MIVGERIRLRPIREGDWESIETWARRREGLWGPYQRFQLDHVRRLRERYAKTGLLSRESGFLLIEAHPDAHLVGFVRYSLVGFPDSDTAWPEVGFGIGDVADRGKGYAEEALKLLLEYLFGGHPSERIGAFTDVENEPAKHVLRAAGFTSEGILRRAMFRDGRFRDVEAFGLLRSEYESANPPHG